MQFMVPELVEGKYIEFIKPLSRAFIKFKQTFEQIYEGVDHSVYPKEKNEIF